MKTFLIAAVAIAVSGAAFAKDLKGSVMTDSEMDKVTAGAAPTPPGFGTTSARQASDSDVPGSHLPHIHTAGGSGPQPGFGLTTAPGQLR